MTIKSNKKQINTTRFFKESINKNMLNSFVYWFIKFMISILILLVAYMFAKNLSNIIIHKIKKHVSEQKKLIIRQLSDVLFYIIFGFGVFIALINIGVQTATIITLLGTLMVTIGFALQSTLTNIFAGIYVALSENFQIGDVIRVYVPMISKVPIEGKVVDFNITYVKLIDPETNKILYLPNASVASNVLVNLSRPVIRS